MKASGLGFYALGLCAGVMMVAGCSRSAYVPSSGATFTTTARQSASRYAVLHVFRARPRGSNPIAPVIADESGNIFGETSQGGRPTFDGGCGVVFELSPSGSGYVEKTLHRFRGRPGDGCSPIGGLTIDSNGAIYGTTESGGLRADGGTVFKLTPAGSTYAYRVLYRFKDDRDGAWPIGPVIVDKAGVIYGATQYGAAYACAANTEGCGTVYSLTPSGSQYTEKILYVFKGGRDGLLPGAGLAIDSNGALYGTTTAGGGAGSIGVGTVFKLTPSGSGYDERVIHAFGGRRDGLYPSAPVIVEPNGAVDGTTLYGGSGDAECTVEGFKGNCGLVFRLTPSSSSYKEKILYNFRGGTDGSQPAAPVIDDDGVLYGTTTDGPSGSQFPCRGACGTVFELQPSASGYAHTVLYRFNPRSGWYPRAGVIVDGGALYGTTYFQGRKQSYAGGTVFRLTL